MVVTSAAVRTVTTGVHRHWLLGPIRSNVNQCRIALRSSTAYRDGVQRQRSYLISHCPTLQSKLCLRTSELVDSLLAVLLHRHRPLGHVRRWWHLLVYRPLVDLTTMEERHVIITYRLDRATIEELCAQLEPDLMSAIHHPTGIPPQVQVLSVLHFLASESFQTTVAIASGMSQPMFSNMLSRVLSALLKHMQSYIVFPQVEDLSTVKGDFYALGHIPNIMGATDGTHVAFAPPAGVNRCTETGSVFNRCTETGRVTIR
ncbi:hypothetical protein NDU88_002939 [Pleurodeles waltl]|uniref:Nuclease HARBI1 n=1 Tax=Pleurodeles waltl TaxID=8319 RepID=A0AAV7RE96_PLEWA|nr:hypothetical protein NDU88_002939 [Pleurodeles waltl]